MFLKRISTFILSLGVISFLFSIQIPLFASGAFLDTTDQDQANVVIALIDLIPDPLTLDDEDSVYAARDAYDALTEDQKALVTNHAILVDAMDQIDRQYSKVQTMIIMIDTITCPVSLLDKDDVIAARAVYELLDSAQKARVTNYSTLVDAEDRIVYLESFAYAVVDLIDAFPETVTLAQKDLVVAAREAYDKLNKRQKLLVSNFQELLDAEQKVLDCEAALVVTTIIDELPEMITIDLIEDVQFAQQSMESLTPPQYEKLDHRLVAKLEQLLLVVEQLKNAQDVIDLIETLPSEITLSNREVVFDTKDSFDALTEDEQALIPSELVQSLQNAFSQATELQEPLANPLWLIISSTVLFFSSLLVFVFRKQLGGIFKR